MTRKVSRVSLATKLAIKPRTRTLKSAPKPLALRPPPSHYGRAWISLVSLSVLIACSHGIADSVPDEHDLSSACGDYASLIGECFGTPKLAETTRKSLSTPGRSAEQVEALEKQCKANLVTLRKACK